MFPGVMPKPGLERLEGLAPSARMAASTAMVDFLASLPLLGVCPAHPGGPSRCGTVLWAGSQPPPPRVTLGNLLRGSVPQFPQL